MMPHPSRLHDGQSLIPGTGLIHYTLDDDILVYHFQDTRRETIDAWVTLTRHYDAVYNQQQRHLRVMFISASVPASPYALATFAQQAQQSPPTLRESMAIVTEDTFFNALLIVLIHRLPQRVRQTVRLFTNREAALAWLRAQQD